jgi:hypothetical protein
MNTPLQRTSIEQLHEIRQKKERLEDSARTEDIIALEHLKIEEDQCKLQLPRLARLTSDEIITVLHFLDTYEQQLLVLQEHIAKVLTTLETNKQHLIPWWLSEVANIILDKAGNQSTHPLVRTGAELLSTWLSTRGLDTDTSQQLIKELHALLDAIHMLQKKLHNQWIILSPQISSLPSLPNLTRVEYIDLAQDILRPAKNRGSVASLLAQTATGRKINQLREELQKLQIELIVTSTSRIPEKKQELNSLQTILREKTKKDLEALLKGEQ